MTQNAESVAALVVIVWLLGWGFAALVHLRGGGREPKMMALLGGLWPLLVVLVPVFLVWDEISVRWHRWRQINGSVPVEEP